MRALTVVYTGNTSSPVEPRKLPERQELASVGKRVEQRFVHAHHRVHLATNQVRP